MHDEVTKALWDFYPAEDKNDFFPVYHYMKHIDGFMYHAMLQSGQAPMEPKEKPPEDVDQMVKHHVLRIAETAIALETSIYHAKVVNFRDAVKLIKHREDINISPPETVMPFKVARDIVLKANDTVAVGSCPCRENVEHPCIPATAQVCMFVGDPFASFIAEQNPKYRKVSLDEAVHVLDYAHQKGLVHCAFFKKEAGNRFGMICNCCGCCCLGVRMWNMLAGTVPILAPSGYVAEINDDCNGCAVCVGKTCSFNAITMDQEKQKAVIEVAKCMGCGVCVDACPTGALSLRRESSKGAPLDLDALKSGSAS